MLTKFKRETVKAAEGRFVIIASKYNGRYVDAMLKAARAELKQARASTIQVFRVPGAFEIPLVASRLARTTSRMPSKRILAIICLGVILRGETVHAAHIGENVSRALMDIQLNHEVPVIHEVLLLENEAQARVRCLSRTHNRGAEAAQTALVMAQLMLDLLG